MTTALKDVINDGDLNKLAVAMKEGQVGTILAGSESAVMYRTYGEVLAVASAAATPTYTVMRLLYAKTAGTGAAGEKLADINGATPGTGEAAANAGGTSIVFNAETTGTGTVEVVYLTKIKPAAAIATLAEDISASIDPFLVAT